MTVIPGMGYFPDRPADPPQSNAIECPECGAAVEDFGSGYSCEYCPWGDGETDRALDAFLERGKAA